MSEIILNKSENKIIETTIIIPAYKEEKGLFVVLPKVLSVINKYYEVIVVDDGSNDRTANIASQFPCRIIKHEINKGKGEALKTGLKAATGKNIIWIDADDSYPAELIPQINEALNTYDIVVCPREYGRNHIPRFNRIGNWLFRTSIRNIYGFKGLDPCTGLYAAKKRHLEAMNLSASRFAIEPEISIKSGRMRLKTLNIPIEYRKRVGSTKLNAIKVGLEDSWTIAKHIFWFSNGKVHG